MTTPIQSEVVSQLEARGFRWIKQLEVGEDDPPSTIVLLIKMFHFIQFVAEVEADGAVNGMVLGDYLRNLKYRIKLTMSKL